MSVRLDADWGWVMNGCCSVGNEGTLACSGLAAASQTLRVAMGLTLQWYTSIMPTVMARRHVVNQSVSTGQSQEHPWTIVGNCGYISR